ncbi:MAG: tRNA (cytidine(34)-2'-O)-methyltransferase [Bacteroidia bacterium]|nr:tRNA (cytidine(34)-2'-O)-methyltransferase [Bacteroidia bacterium]
MPFNIVLIEPEIPNNTGNIGRLCLATDSVLHLVKPYGFTLDDSKLRRAGLDYWKYIKLIEYNSADEFFIKNQNEKMAFYSSHAEKKYTSLDYEDNMFLIFGKESIGLSKELIKQNANHVYKIPMHSTHIRSLNIANAVSIVVYEGLRKLDNQ